MIETSLYARLGGYEGVVALVDDLLPRLQADPRLGRFWRYRGDDGVARERQLLIDFLCAGAGGPMYYTGRTMALAHRGMKIDEGDWSAFFAHAAATMATLEIPEQERAEIAEFVGGLKGDIVDAQAPCDGERGP